MPADIAEDLLAAILEELRSQAAWRANVVDLLREIKTAIHQQDLGGL
jgi:hypothetical protein